MATPGVVIWRKYQAPTAMGSTVVPLAFFKVWWLEIKKASTWLCNPNALVFQVCSEFVVYEN
jgi:hypothetical protein